MLLLTWLVACDGDGLNPLAELKAGTQLFVRDSDGDGKSDGEEVLTLGTDPLRKDTDGDGVNDGAEQRAGTDPRVADATPPATPPPAGAAQDDLELAALRAAGDAPPPAWRCDSGVFPPWVVALACFVEVPAGSLRMGAQAADPQAPGWDPAALPHEAPVRTVQVPRFWIQRLEATAGLYRACADAGACPAEESPAWPADPLRDQHPASGLSWAAADRLCAWLGGRLPTEAEWERAARGDDGRIWPWGPQRACGHAIDRTGREGLFSQEQCAGTSTRNVGDGALRSAFGLVNMAGNVWEWTGDWYGPYDPADLDNPRGPATGTHRTQRGGGWSSDSPDELRASNRAAVPPERRLPDMGVRCAWGR